MHSLFFPMTWQETSVNIQKLWMLECTSTKDVNSMEQLFQNRNYLKDPQTSERCMDLALKINQDSLAYEEVQQACVQAIMIGGDNVVMCDMPAALLRMKIAQKYSLKELRDMFDFTLNKVANGQGPM